MRSASARFDVTRGKDSLCSFQAGLSFDICYNPPTNFSFFPSSGPPSTQPAAPLPQPISTAPAPAPPAQPTSFLQPAPLAFNPFRTNHLPLYDVTDFYEPPVASAARAISSSS